MLKTILLQGKGAKIDRKNILVNNYFKKKNKKTLCFAPEKNLFFGVDGCVSSCYAQSYIFNYGKYTEKSINQLWNSSLAEDIRHSMKNSFLLPACNLCYTQILENNFNTTYANVYDQHEINPNYPVSMEFYLENTCNLECIMCSSENSSSIARKKNIPPIEKIYNDKFVDELVSFIPFLKHTYFFGGEPFLIPIYFDIWNKIIELNPECRIDITTNGSVLNDKVKTILDRSKMNINVSLDSLNKENFERIRKNANFEVVIENLHYFYNYCKTNKNTFFISFCPMIQNWEEIPDILKFANQLNIGLVFNRVWSPSSNAICSLNSDKLMDIYHYLNGFTFASESETQSYNINEFNTLKNQILIWHKSAISLNDNQNVISSQKNCDIIEEEFKKCFIINKKNVLSNVRNKAQLNEKIDLVVSIINNCNLSNEENKTMYRNLNIHKKFFINSFFFAQNQEMIFKLVNMART